MKYSMIVGTHVEYILQNSYSYVPYIRENNIFSKRCRYSSNHAETRYNVLVKDGNPTYPACNVKVNMPNDLYFKFLILFTSHLYTFQSKSDVLVLSYMKMFIYMFVVPLALLYIV